MLEDSSSNRPPAEVISSSGPIHALSGRMKKRRSGKASDGPGFGRPLRIISFTVLIFLASQIVATALVGLQLQLTNGGSLNDALENSATSQFIYTATAELLAVVFILQILRSRRLSLKSIGVIKPKWSDLWRALGAFLVFYLVLAVVSQIVVNFIPQIDVNQPQDVGFKSLPTVTSSVLAFIALAILPPLGEEPLVRGYLYSGLRSRWRFLPAMMVTSLIFGAAHLQLGGGAAPLWSAAIDTFLLSVFLVYLREKTGALWAGILLHFLNNSIAFWANFHSAHF